MQQHRADKVYTRVQVGAAAGTIVEACVRSFMLLIRRCLVSTPGRTEAVAGQLSCLATAVRKRTQTHFVYSAAPNERASLSQFKAQAKKRNKDRGIVSERERDPERWLKRWDGLLNQTGRCHVAARRLGRLLLLLLRDAIVAKCLLTGLNAVKYAYVIVWIGLKAALPYVSAVCYSRGQLAAADIVL